MQRHVLTYVIESSSMPESTCVWQLSSCYDVTKAILVPSRFNSSASAFLAKTKCMLLYVPLDCLPVYDSFTINLSYEKVLIISQGS